MSWSSEKSATASTVKCFVLPVQKNKIFCFLSNNIVLETLPMLMNSFNVCCSKEKAEIEQVEHCFELELN